MTLAREVALQVSLGLLGRGVAPDQAPETIRVSRLNQMGQFMKQYVINDPVRHGLQAVRQSDDAGAWRTRAPALLLVGHPGNRGRLRHLVDNRRQVIRCKFTGPGGQRLIAAGCRCPRFSGEDLLDHVTNEPLFVSLGHALRDEHNDRVAFPVRRHGSGTAAASAHLDPRAGIGFLCPSGFPTVRPSSSAPLPRLTLRLGQRQRWLTHQVAFRPDRPFRCCEQLAR